jgi:two-component sensor histidine kinase
MSDSALKTDDAYQRLRRYLIGVQVAFFADGPETLTLRVRDDGVGLAPDSEHDRGRSLGLKIVRNLTEQIHGQLEIQSRPGTTFQLSFANLKSPS